MLREQIRDLRVGDHVVAEPHRIGDGTRTGEVVEVVDEPGHERCRVRWDDGHETVLYAGTDVRLAVGP